MADLKVMIIGSGFVAGLHLQALATCREAEIAGVVDLDAAKAESLARRCGGVPWSTDLQRACAEWAPDAAIVCTPNSTHLDVGRALARQRVHVLMEKPLATTYADALLLAGEFERSGLVLSAAHTHRFGRYANAIRDVIRGGDIGVVRHVRFSALNGWIWADWRGWQIDAEGSGGHALHNGVHALDLVTWWIDDVPVGVHASGRKQSAAQLDIFDYLVITVRYASGATAVCEFSRASRPRALSYRDVVVAGAEGVARLPWDGEGLRLHAVGRPGVLPAVPEPFEAQLRAWIGRILGADTASVGAADGVRAVALAEAAERSMASGALIDLAQITGAGDG